MLLYGRTIHLMLVVGCELLAMLLPKLPEDSTVELS